MTRRAAAALLLLLLAACGGTNSDTAPGDRPSSSSAPASASASPTSTQDDWIRVVVAGGKVTESPGERVKVKRGDLVRILVEADAADEVHVHAYDLKADVAPGAPTRLEFAATIPGVFEVELEKDHLLLFKLEVG